jgi:hypothetical protein
MTITSPVLSESSMVFPEVAQDDLSILLRPDYDQVKISSRNRSNGGIRAKTLN